MVVELSPSPAFGLWRGIGLVCAGAAVGRMVRGGAAWRVARAGAWGRAGALLLAPVAGPVALALYGAASASVAAAHPRLLDAAQRERHRVLSRLGNVIAPLIVAVLALALSTGATFVALALVSSVAAFGLRGGAPAQVPAQDDADDVVDAMSGGAGRFGLWCVAVAVVAELPVHIAVFGQLGRFLSVTQLALLAAAAEFAGVIANVTLRNRERALRTLTSRGVMVAVIATGAVGVLAVNGALSASSAGGAIAFVAVGALAASAAIPFLTVGSRAVVAGVVPPGPVVLAAGALAVLGAGGVLCAGVTAVASAVVAKVTSKARMEVASKTLI